MDTTLLVDGDRAGDGDTKLDQVMTGERIWDREIVVG